jgi:hypothetical protein
MVSPDFQKLFPTGNTYKMGWWEGEVGGIYNFPTTGKQKKVIIDKPDTTYTATFSPEGGFSYSARLGRYHFTPNLRFFKYIDYSLGYRKVVGSESYKASLSAFGQNEIAQWEGSGTFEESFLMFNFNMNNVLQVTDHTFLQNTLGVNGEYRLQSGKVGYDANAHRLDPEQPPTFFGQLHYRLGYGVRVTKQFFLIPSLQTSVLNLYPFDGASSLAILNSRYQSLSFSIKFLFLKRYRPSGY